MGMIALGSGAAARGLPVFIPYTEATADGNTFVCEFTGGANANETGVGGGLTGADLVLTQNGGWPASSGGFRQGGPGLYFTCTQTCAELIKRPTWTVAHYVDTWAALYSYLYYLGSTVDTASAVSKIGIVASSATTPDANESLITSGVTCYGSNAPMRTKRPATGGYWIVAWGANGNYHVGWKSQSALPTGWDDFPVNQRAMLYGYGDLSSTSFSSALYVLGFSAIQPTVKIGTIVLSKLALAPAPE